MPGAGIAILPRVPADVESARAAYEAFGDGRVDLLGDWLDPEVEWVEPPELPGARTYSGRDRVQRYLASILELWDEFRVEAQRFEQIPEGLLIDVRIRARARASGVSVEDRVLHRVTMRDGKARRIVVEQALSPERRSPAAS